MNSELWLAYFHQNQLHRREPAWSAPTSMPATTARPLARSLSHFQLGESGEGKFLLAEARRAYPADFAYCQALDLFIKEEQEHARLLGHLVARFGGSLIRSHWTHFLFRLLRRALSVHFEIQILVIAELVGTAYYRLLERYSGDVPLAEVCALILRDEGRHVAFHAERCRTNQARWLPIEYAAWAAQFQFFFVVAAHVAWADHRPALTALGATRAEFFSETRREVIAFLDGIVGATSEEIHTPDGMCMPRTAAHERVDGDVSENAELGSAHETWG